MAGFKSPADGRATVACVLVLLALPASSAEQNPLDGTSPGERSAIQAYCSDSRGAVVRDMCRSNQIASLLRLGRKPDLAIASPAQRDAIRTVCADKRVPGERFACEREQLGTLGLPVRDEAGGGPIHPPGAGPVAAGAPSPVPKADQAPGLPYFSLEKWRAERPPMPPARGGPALSAEAIYDRVAPSVYVVVASEHGLELAAATPHAQGSAVAVTDRILLTNCHVVAGRPQISVSQQGQVSRATLIYADPGGDRCFLKSEAMTVHPIQGVRRFSDLHVGEPVYSLGTPVGLERTFGQGMVSGLRQLEGVNFVQNSAPSWHGSSGGGLFDARGNLVGITTAISTTVANLNLSIAADDFWP